MAKEVAGELIRLRANAENHHHHWNRSSIAAIDIIASESIGIEDRATFYEQTGALRDVIQGHLMQLLALVLMKLPGLYTPEDLPVYRQKALDQLVPVNPSGAVRGQYEGYQTEVANQGSHVETFVSLQLVSEDPRWQGVAITLSTGKALDKKRTSVTIMYKDGTKDTFEEGSITYEGRLPDAYERVILEALAGRKSIFTTSREVLRSWQLLSAVQEHWAMDDQPLKLYPRGSALETLR
jgi:glucose-6-phosphate 1-dehydrogenase